MSFLIDTNVVSELIKGCPNRGVVQWVNGADEDLVYLSVVTIAEIRNGIERLTNGPKRRQLEAWLKTDVSLRFDNRILPIDYEVASEWGSIIAERKEQGRPIGVMDGFIAATARVHRLTLVTRNISDFFGSLEEILNPWVDE
ncbi:MAG: type II toxin-antitoxin system VapC family toxin [Acidimicrobiaceae bacterium]|nr:type II toxin-antitoxin system VapC family toxin [Acidimicrobiaceae bacterium]